MARILPSLFLISIITFFVFYFCDSDNIFPNSHSINNLFVSLTLIKPGFFNVFFPNYFVKLDYVNGSYWSLWPEIQFYIIASSLFFISRKHFLKLFFLTTIIISIAFLIFKHQLIDLNNCSTSIKRIYEILNFWVFEIFNTTEFLNWFCIGIIFFLLFKNDIKRNVAYVLIATNAFFILLINPFIDIYIALPLMILVFIIFIERPQILSFLNQKILFIAGAASYNFYLIHEAIGVLSIRALCKFLPESLFLIAPFIVYIILIAVSIGIYNGYEKKVSKAILNKLVKKNN